MAITYHAGRRIQGIETDRLGDGTVSFPLTSYSNTYISIPHSGIGTLTTGSLSFWFKPVNNTVNTGSNTMFSASDSGDASSEWVISYAAATNDFYFLNRENGGSRLNFTGGATFSDDTWYHVVYTNDSSGNKVYVNGSQVTPSYSAGSASTSSFFGHVNNVDSTLIGANKDNASTTQWEFAGNMEQVLIYDDVLTSSEVSTLYNSGSGTTSPSTSNLVRYYKLNGDYNDSVGTNHGTKSGNITFEIPNVIYPVDMPTNVQVGSRFEETDTRKMYHFEAESPIETLDSTNGTTGWNVTNGGSDITIDTSNNEIDITGTGEKSGYYDLGASVSASSWLLRFKITSSGSPTGNPIFWVGMFDVNTIGSRNTNVDGISLMIYTGGSYKLSMKNGTRVDQGGSQTDTSPTVSADTTTRYVEIVRNGSNAILTFYDSDTYTTSIGTCTVAITGSAFRYLCAISYFEGSGRTYSLSNVKFYNGTTTTVIPNAWTEEGT